MGKNTNLSLKANGGGKSIPSINRPSTKKKTAAGKIQKYSAAPLPKQKQGKGTGIAGRASNG